MPDAPDWGHARELESVRGQVAIAGVGETAYTKASGRTAREIGAEAAERAIADAGLDPADIDGLTSQEIQRFLSSRLRIKNTYQAYSAALGGRVKSGEIDKVGNLFKLMGKGEDALAAFAYREAARSGMATREGFQEVKRLERALRRTSGARQDLAQAALDESEQLCPRFADAPATFADALAPLVREPPAAPATPAQGWRPVAFGDGAAIVPLPLAPAR